MTKLVTVPKSVPLQEVDPVLLKKTQASHIKVSKQLNSQQEIIKTESFGSGDKLKEFCMPLP